MHINEKNAPLTAKAIEDFKEVRRKRKEDSAKRVRDNKGAAQRKREGKPGFFNPNKYDNWLF